MSSSSRKSSNSTSSDILSITKTDQDIRRLEDEICLESVLQVIDLVAPNNVYNRGKSGRRNRKNAKKRFKAAVTPHLFTMWQNAEDIVPPMERVAKHYTVARPVMEVVTPVPYPKVDWSCVNSRFIKNLPSPGKFPIHGCSQDPDLYEIELDCYGNTKFNDVPNPFGSAYGYQTSEGIVCVPEEAHHGYVWQVDQWVLHANLPTQPRHEHKRRREAQRGKRGGRRGKRE